MKLKTALHLLGLKPAVRVYGCEVAKFELADFGEVEYAQWLHPKETKKVVRQVDVDRLRAFLSPGDVAIDVGAHTGDSTLPIALAVGNAGVVLALEPNPYVFPVLVKNSRLNPDKTHIEPLPFAATGEDGPIDFEYSDPGFCNGGCHRGVSKWVHGHPFKLTVSGRNLERYLRQERAELLERLRYVKVDAEGYDLYVLRSIRRILEEFRPYVKTEIYKHTPHERRSELWDLLDQLGYRMNRVVDEYNVVGGPVARDEMMNWRHFDMLCVPTRRAVSRAAA